MSRALRRHLLLIGFTVAIFTFLFGALTLEPTPDTITCVAEKAQPRVAEGKQKGRIYKKHGEVKLAGVAPVPVARKMKGIIQNTAHLDNKPLIPPRRLSCTKRVVKVPGDVNSFRGCMRVIYNRVPKCGSRAVHAVLSKLRVKHKFSYHAFSTAATKLSNKQAREFAKEVSQLGLPYLYARHYHFVNFTKYSERPPIYINVVRDPIERLISHYNYRKYGSANKPVAPSDSQTQFINMTLDECVERRSSYCMGSYQRILPYFCGLHRNCQDDQGGTDRMLTRAKRTVMENYLVVGLTEDLPAFMELTALLLPQYFSGAADIYNITESRLKSETKTVQKEVIKKATRQILSKHLAADYEFYRFIKKRFYELLNVARRQAATTSDV